jgi:hypothetical protein
MNTTQKTIQSTAEEIQKQLETKTRPDGTRFICQKDLHIEWITDICRDAHGDRMPSDDVYNVISETVDALAELEPDADEDDARDRLQEIEPPVYTSDLTKWLASHNGNVYYLTQALEEYKPSDGFRVLATAYALWQQEIAGAVLAAIVERVEE